jgi:hypothetical protein
VPQRTEVKLNVPIYEGDSYKDNDDWAWHLTARAGNTRAAVSGYKIKYWLSVALPELKPVRSSVRRTRLRTPQGPVVGIRAHNPAATARITFEAEYGMIVFKTILRGLTKYLATAQVEKKDKFMGLVANLFNVATETADTRSWLTLPEQIQLLRTRLPAGVHDLTVDLLDGSGRSLGTVVIPAVTVRAGDWTFINHRVFDGPSAQ